MKISKVAAIVCCLFVAQSLFGQAKKSEKTVEDDYLNGVEDVIISELASSEDYDNKKVALDMLRDAVSNGKTSPEMVASLSKLAGEGVKSQSRTNGRVMNNFPDVRREACDILGEIKTEKSKNTLVGIAIEDKEPMVVGAAIRSLSKIGINNNDEVVNMISFVHKKYAALNPTSTLALEIVNAYEKLESTVQDKSSMIQTLSEIASNYRYVTPVRQRALQLIKSIQTGDSEKK